MATVTVKKDTISTKKFQKKVLTLIKMVKVMDMSDSTRKILIEELRKMHNECLEYSTPEDPFAIPEELRV